MKAQQVKNIQDLKVGDIIRGKSTKLTYVVVDHYGDRVTAVRTQDVTNPSEWEIIKYNEK